MPNRCYQFLSVIFLSILLPSSVPSTAPWQLHPLLVHSALPLSSESLPLSHQALAPGCKPITMLSSSSQVTEQILRCTTELGCLLARLPRGKMKPALPDAELPRQEGTWVYGLLGICRPRINTNYHPLWIPWEPTTTNHQMEENSILKLLQ